MARVWKEGISPKYLHDDGYQVTSRILITDWGKVEHAAITYNGDEENLFSFDGSRDIPWSVKQEIKNEVFGIHPTKDKQCRVVNRGCPKDPTQLALNSQGMLSNLKHFYLIGEDSHLYRWRVRNKPVRYDLG